MPNIIVKALLTIVLDCLFVLQDLTLVDEALVLCWNVAFGSYCCFQLCNCLLWGDLQAELVPACDLQEHCESTHGHNSQRVQEMSKDDFYIDITRMICDRIPHARFGDNKKVANVVVCKEPNLALARKGSDLKCSFDR